MTAAAPRQDGPGVHCSQRLEALFSRCFALPYATRLVGGAAEPLYLPARDTGGEHRLYYREDYFASALHEVSHWCIAGVARRRERDFGYWYAPEGRTGAQQRAFEAVEAGPQALEWIFSQACAYPFKLSADNFDPVTGDLPDIQPLAGAVLARARAWQEKGLPYRAGRFYRALCREFGSVRPVGALELRLEDLSV